MTPVEADPIGQRVAAPGGSDSSSGAEVASPPVWARRFCAASAVMSASVIALGLLVLIGWTFDIPILVSGAPSLRTTMKANTAILFVALGIGLWSSRSRGVRATRVRRIAGWFVVGVAAITLAEHIFSFDARIDELLFIDRTGSIQPGRMAPATALTLLLLGLALVLHDGRRRSASSHAAALLALVGPLLAVFGYLYGAKSLYVIGAGRVALHTAVGLILSACAFLAAHPVEGLTGLLTSDSEAGRLLRRLLPALVLTPAVIGLIQLHGEAAGYYDMRTGVGLMSLTTLVALTFFSSIIAASLHRSESRRREIETARQRLLEDMRVTQTHLEADVRAVTSLNRIASLLFPETAHLGPILAEVLAAAIAISEADFGSIQILDPATSDLHMVAQHGFSASWLDFWNRLSKGQGSCGTALERGERIIVEDVEQSSIFNADALDTQRKAGVRAVQSTPLLSRSGEPIGIVSTHFTKPHRPSDRTLRLLDVLARQAGDIIERARADQRLQQSEQRFRALVDASAQIVWTANEAGVSAEDSPSWRRFTGQTFDQMLGWRWLDAIHPEDQSRLVNSWHDVLKSKTHFLVEVRVRHRSGSWRWMSISAVPLWRADGTVSGWIGMNIDITAQRNAEAARQRQLREMVENAPNAIAMLDENLRYVRVSPRWLQDFGLGDDVIGRSYYDVLPETPDHWKAVHRRCLAGATEEHDDEPFVRQDGSIQWLRWKICPWHDLEGAIAGILIYTEDITTLRSAVEAARAAQQQLRLAQRVARIGTFDWNIQTGLNTWTPELEQMYGLPVGGFASTKQAWDALVHPDDRARTLKRVDDALATGVPTEAEWRIRWPDGSTHWIAARFQAFMDHAGKPSRLIGINIEITERKLIEEQRERLLDEVRDLTKNLEAKVAERTQEVALARDWLDGIIWMAADAIISIDNDQRITIFNRSAEEIFGWSRAEAIGKPLDVLLPEYLRSAHRNHVAGFAREPAKARRMGERTEVLGLRKNGETFPAEATIAKQKIDGGFQFTVILRDITDRRRLEDERARRYAERAVLLKEIHHRVKNNLQVISSLFYLQEQRIDQETVRKLLDESRGRLYSIALIHDKLYRSEHLGSIDFGDYLRDLTASLTSAIGAPGVTVHVEAEPVMIDLDRAIPCALIVNELVSNSMKHAFPDHRGGEIRVSIRCIDSDLRLEVSDNGIGLPAELDYRKVTTLGLQLVATLAKQLGGTLELRRDEGTTFRIDFPYYPADQRGPGATDAHAY